jgi:phosphatidylserine/phosphatidylglycerophosphate/cardiolipin synthase-like enzyme
MNHRKHLKAALISGSGYGLGFIIGVVLIKLIFDSGLLDSVSDLFAAQHLTIGLIILFLVVTLGGGFAGTIGGLGLTYALPVENPRRAILRSAIGIGFGFGIVLLPITGLLAMLAMYNAGDASPAGFVISMGVVGAIFGFVSGVMTATVPSKSNYWRVTGILTLAFGVGGLAFGFGLWNYFYVLFETGAGTANLVFSFFVFGAVGGAVMGWRFSREMEKAALAGEEEELSEHGNIFYRAGQWFKSTKFYQKRGFWGTVIFFVLIFILTRVLALSPLNFSDAYLAEELPLDTIGVHWSSPWSLTEADIKQPSVAKSDDLIAVTWAQDDGVYYTTSTHTDGLVQVWELPAKISDSAGFESPSPQVGIDSTGRLHFIWVEAPAGEAGNFFIQYRTCLEGDCTEIVTISNPSASCSGDQNSTPTIAINEDDSILVVWDSGSDNLASLSWKAGDAPTGTQSCALADWEGRATNPRVTHLQDAVFVLVFDNGNEIFVAVTEGENNFNVVYQEAGRNADVFVDDRGTVHAAWCGTDGQIRYREEGTLTKTVPLPGCTNRPVLGQDANSELHLIWYSTQAEQPSGQMVETDLIYESRLVSSVWTDPIIVDLSATDTQPALVTGNDGLIHLVWSGSKSAGLNHAYFRNYECIETTLNSQGQLALDVALSGNFRPSDDLVPYCYNQFDSLLILPTDDPAYSDNPPSLNGAFDDVSDLMQTARYEVLLSTMWYEADETGTSPGDVLGQGVKDLYDKVKANPEQYPRGMTVRILLGNPPEFTLSNLISQVWNVFNHLRAAGVPTMYDPEIGWNLEVANFDGSWPHGHTKMVVIDGKTAIAAGFNYQHKHQSKDHPSGKGKDDYDLGLQMTGPVAQTTRLAFDDLWYGSHSIVCPDMDSTSPLWWISCRRETAVADHVPEVKKLYLASENYNAFALHRTTKFQESDITVPKTIAAAQETLDVLQVNFTLPLICDLNLIFQVCDFRDALSYMQAMMEAIKANNVKTRVLIKPGPIEAVESNIAVEAFRDELAAQGLSHLVEFRYFQDSVHAKAVLIDEQFLLVGSQNFHYSAFGDGALTEFNIGTDDPDAVAAFQKFFEYHWERAEPIPEK